MITVHPSMLAAIAALMGADSHHYFETSELDDDAISELFENLPPDATAFEVVDTVTKWITNGKENVCVVEVGNEKSYGHVVVHYGDNNEVVRFLAIP